MKSDEALSRLMEGNARFARGLRSVHTFMGNLHLQTLADKGQNPMAIIVACSDSRAPIETVFDHGLGDLYVLRVAGNVVSDVSMAGIEYAMTYFSVPLCLVLGHTGCGAIQTAVKRIVNPQTKFPSMSIEKLVQSILPAPEVLQGFGSINPSNLTKLISQLTIQNVRQTIQKIKDESTLVRKTISNQKLRIVGGVYHLDSGIVEFDLPKEEIQALCPDLEALLLKQTA